MTTIGQKNVQYALWAPGVGYRTDIAATDAERGAEWSCDPGDARRFARLDELLGELARNPDFAQRMTGLEIRRLLVVPPAPPPPPSVEDIGRLW